MKILVLDLGKFNTMCCYFDTKTRKHEKGLGCLASGNFCPIAIAFRDFARRVDRMVLFVEWAARHFIPHIFFDPHELVSWVNKFCWLDIKAIPSS